MQLPVQRSVFGHLVIRVFVLTYSVAQLATAQNVSITVGNSKDTSLGLNGRLQMFMSTSFQPAEWDDQFFAQYPGVTVPLTKLFPQHIRIQALSQAIPETAPGVWDFSELGKQIPAIQSAGDHSPEFQIAVAPSYMDDSAGHLLPSHFSDFANYAAGLVRYYNTGGLTTGTNTVLSPSGYPITWWGIFNEPNGNGISPDQYVTIYNQTVPAMQAVDSSLKFVAVELSDYGQEPEKFLPTFVGGVTAPVDVVATHFYGSCDQTDPDTSVFAAADQFASDVSYIYSQLRTKAALASVPVWVTENNVNADFGNNGISVCNGGAFVTDPRGTSAFFAAWRPLVSSKLAKVGTQALYHWDFDADAQYGEVDAGTGQIYLSYWVDYYLAHWFPSPPGADILSAASSDSDVEVLATRNDDGSVVVLLANHAVASSSDDNGPGAARTMNVDVSALGNFASATEIQIDAKTDPVNGPTPMQVTPSATMQLTLGGYGSIFLRLNPALPSVNSMGIVNAASSAGGGVSPGELISIYGANIGPAQPAGLTEQTPGIVDNDVAGVRVLFDGVQAPLTYVSATQINAVVPYEIGGQSSTQMVVDYLGMDSTSMSIPVVASAPGIFSTTVGQAAALNADGTVNSAANPAAVASVITLYATGEGATTPAGVTGKVVSGLGQTPRLPVTVTIGGIAATDVQYAGSAPGLVSGVLQVDVTIPQGVAPSSAVPVTVSVGGVSSPAPATIAVQ